MEYRLATSHYTTIAVEQELHTKYTIIMTVHLSFLGVKLAEFINNLGEDHNGLDCFAAQLLVHLKLGIHYGGF